MKTLGKTIGAAIVAGTVALTGFAAAADEIQCYPHAFSAVSPAGTNWKTEDDAHAAAIRSWEAGIAAQLGHIFSDWDIASDRTKNCEQISDGYGGYYYKCEIAAYPCYKVPAYNPPAYEPPKTGGYQPPKTGY